MSMEVTRTPVATTRKSWAAAAWLLLTAPAWAQQTQYTPPIPGGWPPAATPPATFPGDPRFVAPPFGWPPNPSLSAPPNWVDPNSPLSGGGAAGSMRIGDGSSGGDSQPTRSPYGQAPSQFDNSGFGSSGNNSSSLSSANSSGNSTVAPNMIGDLFGMSQPAGIFIAIDGYPIPGGILAAAPGANVGRQKFTENGNPIPHDRVWVDYSHFDRTRLYLGGVDVERGTLGAEKTFFGGFASFELRVPFASTLDRNLVGSFTFPAIGRTTELGNVTLFAKSLLSMNEYYTFAAGLGLTIPTAGDVTVTDVELGALLGGPPVQVLEIRNQSYHLLPYFGGTITPFQKLFVNWVAQLDIDATGTEAVVVNAFDGSSALLDVLDSNYFFFDVSCGYWLFRRPDCGPFGSAHLVQGMAALFEVHHNVAVSVPGEEVGDFFATDTVDRVATTNLTFGLTTLLGQHSTLTTAIVTPVDGNEQFDREFRLIYDYRF